MITRFGIAVAGALALILVQAGPGTDETATQRAEVDDRAKVKTVAGGDGAKTKAKAKAEAIARVVKRLSKGRPVQQPTDAGDLAKYLRALAGRAGVEANGSYLSSRRRDSAPARAPGKNPRPARLPRNPKPRRVEFRPPRRPEATRQLCRQRRPDHQDRLLLAPRRKDADMDACEILLRQGPRPSCGSHTNEYGCP